VHPTEQAGKQKFHQGEGIVQISNSIHCQRTKYCVVSSSVDLYTSACFLTESSKNVIMTGSYYTGLFISPLGISELDYATTKTDTAERSISISRDSLQVFFCTRGLGVLPGSTARGSREEKWRSQ